MPSSLTSKGGGISALWPLRLPLLTRLSRSYGAGSLRLLPCRACSLSRASPLSARRRKLNKPSSCPVVCACTGGVFGSPPLRGVPSDGVRCFHAATMLRTEVNGERGEVCGRRSGVCVGVVVPVSVSVNPVRVLPLVYVLLAPVYVLLVYVFAVRVSVRSAPESIEESVVGS